MTDGLMMIEGVKTVRNRRVMFRRGIIIFVVREEVVFSRAT